MPSAPARHGSASAKCAALLFTALALLAGCQPANPPPTPLPTKENTIDKVKAAHDKAMKQAEDLRKEAEIRDSGDPDKKGS